MCIVPVLVMLGTEDRNMKIDLRSWDLRTLNAVPSLQASKERHWFSHCSLRGGGLSSLMVTILNKRLF